MSDSVRWKEIRVRQEIYKEFLKQRDVPANGAGSNGAEAIEWNETALEVNDLETC
jgi:hypothetical protein